MNPNPIDLTTLKAVKGYATVGGATDDDVIQAIITSFSQYVLTRTGRDSLNSIVAYDETYDGNGSSRFFLRNSPIASVELLQIESLVVQASSGFGLAGYFIEQSKRSLGIRSGTSGVGLSYSFSASGPFFKEGLGNVRVQYHAGYPALQTLNELQTVKSNTISLNLGPWSLDLGVVYYPSLTPLAPVPSAPAVGQYAVSNGVYVFNSADNNAIIAVSYKYLSAPADLELACRQAVSVYYKRRQWIDQKSQAMSQGAGTISFRDWKLPPEVEVVLQSYTRRAIV